MWHGRYGPLLALVLVALPFVVILSLVVALAPAEETNAPEVIRTTAMVVDDHAAAMIRVGDKIGAAAKVGDATGATWAVHGQHLLSDGHALRDLAGRLRQSATVVEADPMHRGSSTVAAAALEARWEQLRADGRATAEHGRVMVDLARRMATAVPPGVLGDSDIGEIERASAGMIDAGEHVVRCATTLLASIEQMQRWMGR